MEDRTPSALSLSTRSIWARGPRYVLGSAWLAKLGQELMAFGVSRLRLATRLLSRSTVRATSAMTRLVGPFVLFSKPR